MSPRVFETGRMTPAALSAVLQDWGFFRIADPRLSERRCQEVLNAAHKFFELPALEKSALAIERSSHFRGYSVLHNERDYREQLHLGTELPSAGDDPVFLKLQGPNLWPADPSWKATFSEYLADVAAVGIDILRVVARSLALSGNYFDELVRDAYLLMKLICYHPQRQPASPRPGVAAHVDFSWLTLTLQDEIGGLELRRPDGVWTRAEPLPGTVLVHVGELLHFITRGRYAATPHRVINPSSARSRISIPIFLNPGLRARIEACVSTSETTAADAEHVHRVLRLDAPQRPFVFGEAEWKRKGENVWCAECVPT
jgi:isopenicillin N synthase-like dioxygenase